MTSTEPGLANNDVVGAELRSLYVALQVIRKRGVDAGGGINVHDLGDGTTAGPLVGLVATA